MIGSDGDGALLHTGPFPFPTALVNAIHKLCLKHQSRAVENNAKSKQTSHSLAENRIVEVAPALGADFAQLILKFVYRWQYNHKLSGSRVQEEVELLRRDLVSWVLYSRLPSCEDAQWNRVRPKQGEIIFPTFLDPKDIALGVNRFFLSFTKTYCSNGCIPKWCACGASFEPDFEIRTTAGEEGCIGSTKASMRQSATANSSGSKKQPIGQAGSSLVHALSRRRMTKNAEVTAAASSVTTSLVTDDALMIARKTNELSENGGFYAPSSACSVPVPPPPPRAPNPDPDKLDFDNEEYASTSFVPLGKTAEQVMKEYQDRLRAGAEVKSNEPSSVDESSTNLQRVTDMLVRGHNVITPFARKIFTTQLRRVDQYSVISLDVPPEDRVQITGIYQV